MKCYFKNLDYWKRIIDKYLAGKEAERQYLEGKKMSCTRLASKRLTDNLNEIQYN